MIPRSLRFVSVAAIAIVLGVLLLRSGATPTAGQVPGATTGARTDPALPPAPAKPAAAVIPAKEVDPPASKPSSPALATKIEPGTPPEFLKPYLHGYTPAEIYKDGTQIYHDVPFYVRQPDGTMKRQSSMVKIQPTAPAPILEEFEQPGPRNR